MTAQSRKEEATRASAARRADGLQLLTAPVDIQDARCRLAGELKVDRAFDVKVRGAASMARLDVTAAPQTTGADHLNGASPRRVAHRPGGTLTAALQGDRLPFILHLPA